jgi:hypothetical protein
MSSNDVEMFLLQTARGYRYLRSLKPELPRTLEELVYVLGRPSHSRHRHQVCTALHRQHCYENAWTQVEADRTLVYCEGYAIEEAGVLPVLHGYALTPDGRVVDPSWGDGGAVQYFGIAFDPEFAKRAWTFLSSRHLMGILPNLAYLAAEFSQELLALMQGKAVAARRAAIGDETNRQLSLPKESQS